MNTLLIAVVGPTGSGKSRLALELARTFSGEILNCDSVQVYKYLNIGTAKLSKEEQLGVPHHLMDFLEPDQLFTAGEYVTLGRKVLCEVQQRRRIPVVAGGTGLYLRALLDGLFEGPKRSESFRVRLNELAARKGVSYLHKLLKRVDAVSARQIASRDKPKIIRALEVFFLTSKPLSSHFQGGRDALQGFEILKIGLNPPRTALYQAIDRRVERMFADGLVHEVRTVLARGFGEELKPLQSLGYAQVIRHLRGEIHLTEAVSLAQNETRRYAKRQLTWFRKEKNVAWYEGFGSDPLIQSSVMDRVASFMGRQDARTSISVVMRT